VGVYAYMRSYAKCHAETAHAHSCPQMQLASCSRRWLSNETTASCWTQDNCRVSCIPLGMRRSSTAVPSSLCQLNKIRLRQDGLVPGRRSGILYSRKRRPSSGMLEGAMLVLGSDACHRSERDGLTLLRRDFLFPRMYGSSSGFFAAWEQNIK